jgi:hypothetical protein
VTAVEALNCEEFRVLQSKFSSGVRFTELKSIAAVLASLADLAPPDRETKRQYVLLINWFRIHWRFVAPFLPLVQLRDEFGVPITGQRELLDKGVMRWITGQ